MTTTSPSVPAQAAQADCLQHGGYDRHLRKLRHALETQQALMLASAARHFPASIRVPRPGGGYFLWFELPGRSLRCSWPWPRASAWPRGRSSRPPDASATVRA